MSGRLDEPRPSRPRPLLPPVEIRHHRPWPDQGLASLGRQYLIGRGLDADLAWDNGWYTSAQAGDEEPRIVVPCTGKITKGFWQARAIVPGVAKRWLSPHGPRGDAVALVYPSPTRRDRIVVVEGPMCALAAAGLGFLGVSLLGATPSREVMGFVSWLCRGTRTILLADSDSPATMAALVPVLAEAGVPVELRIPSRGKDLADLSPLERSALLADD